MTNETLKVIEKRSSCGAFLSEMPEKEKLDGIVEAALHSPSSTNSQPWRIILLTNKEVMDEMEKEALKEMSKIPSFKGFYDLVTSKGMKLFYNAPCMIVLPYDTTNPYAKFDCGILSQTIALAAESLGIGSHIIAINEVAFKGEKGTYFKKRLGFPENYEFGLSVLLGKSEKEKEPHAIDEKRVIRVD